MQFPLYIAGRYTITRSKNTAVNIITMIAVLGIVVSTAALFVIMSVFGGLKEFSLSFANDTDPDLKATPITGKSFFVLPEQLQQLKTTQGIAAYSFIAEERVLFFYNEKEEVAYMKGVDSLYTSVTGMHKRDRLIAGEWIIPYSGQAVVGAGIFSKLSLGLYNINNPLEVYVPKAGEGMVTEKDFSKEQLLVTGVYSVNDDIDNRYVFCSLDLAQKLLQFKNNQYSAVEIKLKPGANEAEVKNKLVALFGKKLEVKDRQQLNDSLYKMLNSENLVTYLFCSLVVVLTLFCLAGALIMLILDKRENIKTLYNLGAEIKSLRNIFFLQGIFITTIGAVIGLGIGLAIILAQQNFGLVMITTTMPYPTAISSGSFAIVLGTIFILGLLASRIAAGRVNRQLLES